MFLSAGGFRRILIFQEEEVKDYSSSVGALNFY